MKRQIATKQVQKLSRQDKAKQIVQAHGVTQIDRYSFLVISQSNPNVGYGVYVNNEVTFCECPDVEFNGVTECKHILACLEFKSQKVQSAMIEARIKAAPRKYKVGVVQ